MHSCLAVDLSWIWDLVKKRKGFSCGDYENSNGEQQDYTHPYLTFLFLPGVHLSSDLLALPFRPLLFTPGAVKPPQNPFFSKKTKRTQFSVLFVL